MEEIILNEIPSDYKNERNYYYNTSENILNITYDTQGIYWQNSQRESYFTNMLNEHSGYRCESITAQEKIERRDYHNNKVTDIFFQFKKFISNIHVKYTHFQVRKNFYIQDNLLVFPKRFGIQSFNTVTQKLQTLCELPPDDSIKSMICFDYIKTKEGDCLICKGSTDGSIDFFKISKAELDRVKEYRENVLPKYESILSKTISHGQEEQVFTNYVKFFKDDGQLKILTTGNDGFIRIFDVEGGMELVQTYKSLTPINNCDYNFSQSLLGCVGDCTDVELFDTRTQNSIKKFKSHYDYGIVLKFQPESNNNFATGNQDFSCKLWDLRKITDNNENKISESLKTLWGNFDSIGDLLFTKNYKTKNQFLIFAENTSFLHCYNLKYDTIQSLTFSGELSGLAYHQEKAQIFLGVKLINSGVLVYDHIFSDFNDNLFPSADMQKLMSHAG